ncbi:hypothetical protein N7535_006153 [Penicillium sp. DV-2018c]|nr:hypothetical protein N7535_006153 [Penicillium sp. DV-2018c]
MSPSSPPALPLELWRCIESYLSNADIKSLRLSCKHFHNAVPLRLNRVFLCANPLYIEIFRNIASHDKFRHQVNEIIWNEALLHRVPAQIAETNERHELLSEENEPTYETEYREETPGPYELEWGCPRWFSYVKYKIGDAQRDLFSRDMDKPAYAKRISLDFVRHPLKERWQHYLLLLRQQEDVLANRSDLDAFAFGVKRFPALRRVNITPAAHGNLIIPLSPTPMIHALPKGFSYRIPRDRLDWPRLPRPTTDPATAYTYKPYPELRDQHRAFRTAMRVLANEPNSVSELVLPSNSNPTGINCTIFDEPSEVSNDFVTLLKKPGFRRLDIALFVDDGRDEDVETCRRSLLNGRLRRTLGEAQEMEEFSLRKAPNSKLSRTNPLILLKSVVPVEQWSKLRHFAISGFVISQDDCVSFLQTLPKSVRSIELSMLRFSGKGNWYSMLEEIRRKVLEGTLWGDRDAAARPKITIGESYSPLHAIRTYGRGHWIEKEVEDFSYGEEQNPFIENSDCIQARLVPMGWFRKALEPDIEHDIEHPYIQLVAFWEGY